jgi:hypothetical protein
MLGCMVMLARRKAARSTAYFFAFVARHRCCPRLKVVEMYVMMEAMPLVTEVAHVMPGLGGVPVV